jgi:MerR family redox-sensitive transcriptional activator SoxR
MKIGELAARAKLAASAIRYYEREGLLAPPARAGGMRVYGPRVMHELAVVQFAKDAGSTLPEIKQLLHGFPTSTPASERWKKLARRKIAEMDENIAKAQAMKGMLERVMKCQCQEFEQCAEGMARRAEARRKILARASRLGKRSTAGPASRPKMPGQTSS